MKEKETMTYETPQAEVITLELEQAVLDGSGYDPDGTGRDPMEG
jgi:hypothetical protein